MTEPPRTPQELYAALPPEAWIGSSRDLASVVGAARDRLGAVRERAQREINAAHDELTSVVVEAWVSGASWRTIGVLLGVSRQAAARRFGAAVRAAVDQGSDG